MKTLFEIEMNETVEILYIQHNTPMKRRLLDLGFVKGSKVTPVLNSPSKGMRAYLIKGCKIALRESQSAQIFVERLGGDDID
ncbi:MAG: FeoA family protein [Longicatena sp.]